MDRDPVRRRAPTLASRSEPLAWRLRGHLYRRIRETGEVPSRTGLLKGLGVSAGEVDRALRFLADAHVVVLDGAGEVLMAHPFSGVETPFRVETPGGSYWANCAWDAIAIPLLLGTDGHCAARCPRSHASIDLAVAGGRVEPDGGCP